MLRILITDDHPVTRRGIREILIDGLSDVEIGEASDLSSLMERLTEQRWALLLLDILMQGANALEVIPRIRQTQPHLPILVLTAAPESEYVIQAMRAGAQGLIYKHRATDQLLAAVHSVAAGGTYLDAEGAAVLAESLRAPPGERLPHQRLSARELEIFLQIARGRAVKEIAGELSLSDKTVATYLARIREKTGLFSHVEIARYALHERLVD